MSHFSEILKQLWISKVSLIPACHPTPGKTKSLDTKSLGPESFDASMVNLEFLNKCPSGVEVSLFSQLSLHLQLSGSSVGCAITTGTRAPGVDVFLQLSRVCVLSSSGRLWSGEESAAPQPHLCSLHPPSAFKGQS